MGLRFESDAPRKGNSPYRDAGCFRFPVPANYSEAAAGVVEAPEKGFEHRERPERTLFTLDWISDPALRRRTSARDTTPAFFEQRALRLPDELTAWNPPCKIAKE